jgi:hypothetical protein
MIIALNILNGNENRNKGFRLVSEEYFLGGLLWGVAGMILFVPFLGILKLVADHNPKLKAMAMGLGRLSQAPEKNQDFR